MLLPIPFSGNLVRIVSRAVPQDQLSVADARIAYAKRHGLIADGEEARLALALAPRTVRRALTRIRLLDDTSADSPVVRASEAAPDGARRDLRGGCRSVSPAVPGDRALRSGAWSEPDDRE